MAKAVRQFSSDFQRFSADDKIVTKWVLTDADPNGDYLELPHGQDRSVQVHFAEGTGTVVIQGTNEPTPANPVTLKNAADGTALSSTSSFFAQILEVSLKIRPILTGGAGATINVYLCSNSGAHQR